MKKSLVFLLVLTGTLVFTTSCMRNILHGEGKKGTASPGVASFNAIEIDLPVKASITVLPGSQPGVQFSGYENIIKHLSARVKNNTLILTSDLNETWDIDMDDVSVQVSVPSLSALSLSGAAGADIHGNVTGPEFKLETSGASKVAIDNINVDNFSSEGSGATNIEVKGGSVKTARYEISGAGKIKAFPLQTNETSASISGAGKGEVTAMQKLSVEISGAGHIAYKGHPAVSQEISGAGSVNDAN